MTSRNTPIDASQGVQIENGTSETTPEILHTRSSFQQSVGVELTKLWLAVDAADHGGHVDAANETNRPERLKANAHLCRLLNHLRFLTNFGSPHLLPLIF